MVPYRDLIPEKKGRKQGKKTLFAFFQLAITSALCYLAFRLLNRRFAVWFTDGNANYYGNLTAWLIVLFILPKVFRVSSLKVMDLLSPGLPICLSVAKLACAFQGCCFGFEMEGSFYYNQDTGRYEFPIQIVEALTALGLFIFLTFYKKRNRLTGSVFPIYLILYSISRFITEFFRADFPNIFGPFDAYQVMSFIFLIVGCGLLYFLWIYKYESDKRDRLVKSNHK